MKKGVIGLIAIFLVVGFLGTAGATSVTYNDNPLTNIFWPTWGNGSDDSKDYIFDPDVKSVTVTFDSTTRALQTIDVEFSLPIPMIELLYYGGSGLFIDTNADNRWNYFAKDGDLYAVDVSLFKGVNDAAYVMSRFGNALPGQFTQLYREDHPVGIVIPGSIPGTFVLAGPDTIGYSLSGQILTYNFTGLASSIVLGSNYMIGYTEGCANDVFLSPVPEPASMMLIGAGLIGLAGYGRKRIFKKG